MMHNSSGDASQKMGLLGRSSWNRVLSIILIHLPGEVASVWIQTTTDQAAPGGLKDFSVEKMTSGMLCTMYTTYFRLKYQKISLIFRILYFDNGTSNFNKFWNIV